ncbi:Fructosamine kinase-domain-containing protein [Xylariaceae sp. FL0662B]|nr:Fructosamine kinase-domain-containing protein [Xylariaceae sp. FL0662B]
MATEGSSEPSATRLTSQHASHLNQGRNSQDKESYTIDEALIENTAGISLEDDQASLDKIALARMINANQNQAKKNANIILGGDIRDSLKASSKVVVEEPNQNEIGKNASLPRDEEIDALEDMTEAWWTANCHIIPQYLIEDVDDNVKALLPDGTEIISIDPHGNSSWSRTAEIQTELDGQPVSYFLKVNNNQSGEIMYRCEFESLKAIYDAIPGFCPRPLGCGHYAGDPSAHFLLSEFVDMIDEPADVVLLPQRLAELHKKAVAPDGQYGWHVPMTGGQLPVRVSKSQSWEDFFTRYMRFLFRAEEIARGPRPPEMEKLVTALFNRIIPRLLRPLETGGRDIVPRLLHTDLWDGNTSVDEDGLPIVFDPSSMYGHNEFDLGVWSNPRVMAGPPFINSYHNFFGQSPPEEDHRGRNILYSLAFETRVSAIIIENNLFRDEVIRYMSELNRNFPESYEEWALAKGEKPYPPKASSSTNSA